MTPEEQRVLLLKIAKELYSVRVGLDAQRCHDIAGSLVWMAERAEPEGRIINVAGNKG